MNPYTQAIARRIEAGDAHHKIARRFEISPVQVRAIAVEIGAYTPPPPLQWNADTIAKLKLRWAQGASCSKIGEELGVSKNSIAGKVKRLGLPPRPSPIGSDLYYQPRTSKRKWHKVPAGSVARSAAAAAQIKSSLLPAAVTETVTMPPTIFSEWGGNHREIAFGNGNRVAVRGLTLTSIQEAVAETPLVARHIRKPTACCWPIGEPGTRGFRFCESEARAGRSYCGDHCSIAYVTARDRQEDAA